MQIEGIAKRVAEKLNITQELSEEICKSEFKFILDTVKDRSNQRAINCIYLCKFYRNKKYNKDGTKRNKGDFFRIQEPSI